MTQGKVMAIHISAAAGSRMEAVASARAVPGRGLEGDRYFLKVGFYSPREGPHREVTLVETEALEALKRDYRIEMEASETRRNIATQGVALNHLVGREFRVGEVRLYGVKLCEPCHHLEEVSGKKVRKGLVHRGGLRAQVVSEGTVRVGDPIVVD